MNSVSAIASMCDGKKVSRREWNDANQYITTQMPDENGELHKPYFYISQVNEEPRPWTVKPIDIIADDWYVVEEIN